MEIGSYEGAISVQHEGSINLPIRKDWFNPLGDHLDHCSVFYSSDFHMAPLGQEPKSAPYYRASHKLIPNEFWRGQAMRNNRAFRKFRSQFHSIAESGNPALIVTGGDFPDFVGKKDDVDDFKARLDNLNTLILNDATKHDTPIALFHLAGNHDFNSYPFLRDKKELARVIGLANYWYRQMGTESFIQFIHPTSGTSRTILGLNSELYASKRKAWLDNAVGSEADEFRQLHKLEVNHQNTLLETAAKAGYPITVLSHHHIPFDRLPIAGLVDTHIFGHEHLPKERTRNGINRIVITSAARSVFRTRNEMTKIDINSQGKQQVEKVTF